MKHLKLSCQKHRIDSLLLSFKCMTNDIKNCSFLHAHIFELMKVVENLFKKSLWLIIHLLSRHMLLIHIGIASYRQFQFDLQLMLLKIRKKTIWKFTFSKYHVHCLYLFLNIPNCQSVLKFQSLYCKLFIFA